MTQRQRVLEALIAAGSRGVHTFELRQAFIGNPSQRIADLEAEGYVITHTRERLHGTAIGTRYRLVAGARTASGAGSVGGPEQGEANPAPTLALDLEVTPSKPQSAIFGYEADAA